MECNDKLIYKDYEMTMLRYQFSKTFMGVLLGFEFTIFITLNLFIRQNLIESLGLFGDISILLSIGILIFAIVCMMFNTKILIVTRDENNEDIECDLISRISTLNRTSTTAEYFICTNLALFLIGVGMMLYSIGLSIGILMLIFGILLLIATVALYKEISD